MPGPEPSDDALKLLRLVHMQPGGFATARDIEPDTNVGYKQTRNRLDDLVEDGLLNRRKLGSTKTYYLSDAGETALLEGAE